MNVGHSFHLHQLNVTSVEMTIKPYFQQAAYLLNSLKHGMIMILFSTKTNVKFCIPEKKAMAYFITLREITIVSKKYSSQMTANIFMGLVRSNRTALTVKVVHMNLYIITQNHLCLSYILHLVTVSFGTIPE